MAGGANAAAGAGTPAAGTLRRQFDLPEEDVEHLEARGLPWETVVEGGARWVLIHDFPVPAGYTSERVTAAVRVTPGYPTAQLDMVYVRPPLARRDGAGIGALSTLAIDGETYQQWSRHRTPLNPWRPGLDNLATHLTLVEEWLAREFRTR